MPNGIRRRQKGPREWTPRDVVPPWMVVSAPEESGLTPDDLIIEPAWTKEEIEALWDVHDGRTMGTMVVGVFKFDPEAGYYARDASWGILGDMRKTGPADPEKDLI